MDRERVSRARGVNGRMWVVARMAARVDGGKSGGAAGAVQPASPAAPLPRRRKE